MSSSVSAIGGVEVRRRRGMALAVTIGVVSLIAILAVATLSLATRLVQDSSLGIRDARLDAAVGFGLTSALEEWRPREIGRLAIGATVGFPVGISGVPVSVSVTVTRIGGDVFWVSAEALGGGGAVRRESLILRRRMPDPQAIVDEDSTNVATLVFLSVDSIAATADVVVPAGAVIPPPGGVAHALGNVTIQGGKAGGILVVEGVLTIAGPLEFAGIVIAKGGISVTSPGVSLTGVVRAGSYPAVPGSLMVNRSAAVSEDVMTQSLMPVGAKGRRWAEVY